jgi:hypothetical protein
LEGNLVHILSKKGRGGADHGAADTVPFHPRIYRQQLRSLKILINVFKGFSLLGAVKRFVSGCAFSS